MQKEIKNIIPDKLKPCPFCGETELVFDYNEVPGHGDSGFENLRVKCTNCSGSKGNGFDYGRPTLKDYKKVVKQWNKRKDS